MRCSGSETSHIHTALLVIIVISTCRPILASPSLKILTDNENMYPIFIVPKAKKIYRYVDNI